MDFFERHGYLFGQFLRRRLVGGLKDAEGRALAQLRGEEDVAARLLDDAVAGGEAEPGAAIAPGGGVVGLQEGLEYHVLFFVRNARAGVAHGKVHMAASVRCDAQFHFAVIGELHRVAHEVVERLLDEISFEGPDLRDKMVTIDKAYVDQMLSVIVKNEDLSRYIL